jgi:hypothetical protein
MARPSEFSQETADAICERIADGESLRSICRDDEMPAASTVFKWLTDFKPFSEQYAHAREAQADSLFDEMLDIADNAQNDWMERRGEEDAGWVANGEHIQRSKLRIDARKWMAGKLRPKKYGEKIEQTLVGPNGGPIKTDTRFEIVLIPPDKSDAG